MLALQTRGARIRVRMRLHVSVRFGPCQALRSTRAMEPRAGGGRIGDAAYAELIAEQLALDNVLRHYMRGAATGPAVDHFLASYEKGLRVRMGL